ncbi:hypothetical protein [Deinococcus hopiensis]|uniref:Uncharacterized protein n=1 Tax=Deinococcus hopiensis KR-140 TaxID=695939 RepID=A0A1W1UU24_9DEIO|nr:hypothetical protein [Deinococcus hopiensis]SMB84607.1 hypothetical protein SAMN00790413_05213 [Deinococcus hopiensis KR-140]
MSRDTPLAWATAKQLAVMNNRMARKDGMTPQAAADLAMRTLENFLLDAGYGEDLFDKEKDILHRELLSR